MSGITLTVLETVSLYPFSVQGCDRPLYGEGKYASGVKAPQGKAWSGIDPLTSELVRSLEILSSSFC